MRNLLALSFALVSVAACTTSPRRAPDPMLPEAEALSPATPPEAFSSHPEVFQFRWGPRTFRAYAARTPLKDVTSATQRELGFGPVVEIEEGARRRLFDLREKLPAHRFVKVYGDEQRGRIILVLEKAAPGAMPLYRTWISEDGGEKWFAGGDIPRPARGTSTSELVHLWMDHAGRGGAWLQSDEGGMLYRAYTGDGGLRWRLSEQTQNGVREVPARRP